MSQRTARRFTPEEKALNARIRARLKYYETCRLAAVRWQNDLSDCTPAATPDRESILRETAGEISAWTALSEKQEQRLVQMELLRREPNKGSST